MQQDTVAGGRPANRARFRELDQHRFFGVVSISIGVSQLLVAYLLLPDHSQLGFAVGSAGWLLVAIGSNLLRGRDAFASDWHEDETHGWFSLAVVALVTIAILVSSVLGVLSW